MYESYGEARTVFMRQTQETISCSEVPISNPGSRQDRLNSALRVASEKVLEGGLRPLSVETLYNGGFLGIGRHVIGVRVYHQGRLAA